MTDHQRYMQRALELAARGSGTTAPNPMVGAVLVHNNIIIGEGWHQQWGQPHAEVNCLDSVPASYRHLISNSTMYVTLEPCAHWGKQPPCALRLVQEGIKHVVIANHDPFPQVSGRGLQILRNAGIQVEIGILDAEATWLNRRFFTFYQHQRPYIILKWAASSDGYIAPLSGRRTTISNHFSHTLSHRWRTEEAAIVVGTNTALHDNPQLIPRHWHGPSSLRIALDRTLKIPDAYHLLDCTAPTWIINELKDSETDNLHYINIPFNKELISNLLSKLYNSQKLSLIVEGGSSLLQSFIEAGIWDEARIFSSPLQLGNGIKSPSLYNGHCMHSSHIHSDILDLWINENSSYSYPPGALL